MPRTRSKKEFHDHLSVQYCKDGTARIRLQVKCTREQADAICDKWIAGELTLTLYEAVGKEKT